MIMNDEVYLAFMLALSDQLTDLQKNKNTYPNGKVISKAYHQIMELISKLKQNPEVRLTPYNGEWHTKEEIDKMFYRNEF